MRRALRTFVVGVLLLLPAFCLAAAGLLHLRNGLAVNAAFPVPLLMSVGRPTTRLAYIDAARALAGADRHDGEARLAAAQSDFHAGAPSRQVLAGAEAGLGAEPASAQGWTFYAEALAPIDHRRAAAALDQAYTLAPYDYFLAGRRARLAALVWNDLDRNDRDEFLRQVRLLWQEPVLHDQIMPFLAVPNAGKILTLAYAQDSGTLRAINRFVSAERRRP